jgi:hypothetical protein
MHPPQKVIADIASRIESWLRSHGQLAGLVVIFTLVYFALTLREPSKPRWPQTKSIPCGWFGTFRPIA